ncbi:MAG TPA: sulfite exporter TauE/SafE family protein [Mycobacteriales bacterium]|nr:sulfite exporter TauE/SafE family protein [Mycobacteriales bacterium]
MWAAGPATAFLGAAGILAGICSSSGAIGSLVSYPALLAVGIAPLPANVTNAVAVTGTAFGAAARSRPELRGSGPRLLEWGAVTAAGGAAGATLLLLTPRGSFRWIVPFLVAAGALALFFQPHIYAWRQRREYGDHLRIVPIGLFAFAFYEGYFGAASGVMTLALLMITVETQLARANALKNVLLGVADVVASIAFIIFGPVHWAAAIPLGIGFLLGGMVGPSVARRVPARVLRLTISTAGLCLAGWLLSEAIRG